VGTLLISSVGRNSEETVAYPEDTIIRRQEVKLLMKSFRDRGGSVSYSLRLTHFRGSGRSNPESGLLYWVSRVYDDVWT